MSMKGVASRTPFSMTRIRPRFSITKTRSVSPTGAVRPIGLRRPSVLATIRTVVSGVPPARTEEHSNAKVASEQTIAQVRTNRRSIINSLILSARCRLQLLIPESDRANQSVRRGSGSPPAKATGNSASLLVRG